MKSLLNNTISGSEVDNNLLEVVIGGGNRILSVINDKGIVHYVNQGNFLVDVNLRQAFTDKSYTELLNGTDLAAFEALLAECREEIRLTPQHKFNFTVGNSSVALCVDEMQYIHATGQFVLFLLPPLQDIGLIAKPDEQYKALFLLNPLPMWIYDPETFRFLEVNEAAINHYGYSREEFLSMTAKDIRSPEEQKKFDDYVSQQNENKNFRVAGMWRHLKKDGTEICVDITSRIVNFNNTQGTLVLAKDVTNQYNAETALKQSETRLRTLIEVSDEIIIQLGPTMQVNYISNNVERILGYTADEVLSHQRFNLTHPDDAAITAKAMGEVMAGPGAQSVSVFRIQHKDGHYIWVESTSVNMLYTEGVNGIIITMRDVTAFKEGFDAIRENAETIATILDSIADSFYVLDKDWRVRYWNKAAEGFIGKKKEEVMGEDIRDCFPSLQNENSPFVQAFKRVMETHKPERIEAFGDTTQRWVDTSIYPAGDGLSVYFRDVSERVKQEQELKQLNDALSARAKELAASNAELERFAYVASHDLQEPLRMVSSFMQLLKRKYNNELDPIAQQYIHYAVDGAERMNQLILDLLQYSRVGTNKDNFTKIDLNELLGQVSILFRDELDKLDATLTVGAMPTVSGVKSQLSQLFQNLIGNAIKYRSDDTLHISIQAEDNGNEWLFTIADNGIGIEEAYFHKIFIIFQRLHNKEKYSGTGIGLAVCKKITERHGGKIWVQSTPGAGSTFYFTIPKI